MPKKLPQGTEREHEYWHAGYLAGQASMRSVDKSLVEAQKVIKGAAAALKRMHVKCPKCGARVPTGVKKDG